MSTKLAHQTQKAAGIGNGMRSATVAAVSGSTVTLSVAGGQFSSGVGVLESYAPQVGDTVAVFRQDSSWLVLGAVGSNAISARAQLTGTTSISFTSVSSFTQAVTFGGLSFPTAPVVTPNIDSGSGSATRWIARAINISTTGFTMFVMAADAVAGTWSNIPVSWVATARQ